MSAVTVLELAKHRLGVHDIQYDPDRMTGADFEQVGLPMMGGCEVCGATVAAYNSCPSKSGYLRCANGCIADTGWDDVAECNSDLFEDGS